MNKLPELPEDGKAGATLVATQSPSDAAASDSARSHDRRSFGIASGQPGASSPRREDAQLETKSPGWLIRHAKLLLGEGKNSEALRLALLEHARPLPEGWTNDAFKALDAAIRMRTMASGVIVLPTRDAARRSEELLQHQLLQLLEADRPLLSEAGVVIDPNAGNAASSQDPGAPGAEDMRSTDNRCATGVPGHREVETRAASETSDKQASKADGEYTHRRLADEAAPSEA